jgi:hypothetical protein
MSDASMDVEHACHVTSIVKRYIKYAGKTTNYVQGVIRDNANFCRS